MAVFFINSCKFNGCGKNFPTLSSLIEHIEASHIDFDPKVAAEFEQQRPSSLPLSYVLKYSHCRQRKGTTSIDIRIRLLQHASKVAFERNNNLVGMNLPENDNEEDEEIMTESESSNDSWTPSKGVHLPGRKIGGSNLAVKDKPYACSVPGCKKRYKNINGIKYHCKNGHNAFEKSKKADKHVSKKKNKNGIFKITPKRVFEGEAVVVTSPVAATTVDLVSSSINYNINLNHNISGNNDAEVVSEQLEKELKKHVFMQEHSDNNNKLYDVDCKSTCISIYSPWPAGNMASKNEVTIIRPSTQINNVPNPQSSN